MTGNDAALWFRAGPAALDRLRRDGFRPDALRTLVGASGGPKWLVLSQIDRALIDSETLTHAPHLHLLGSSIGAWRAICHAQADPMAAIDRFEQAYIHQSYTAKPDTHEITAKSRAILDQVLGPEGASQILAHPRFHLSVMTVRARGPAALEPRALQAAGLALAALANAVSRRALGRFFERALFFDPRRPPPFLEWRDLPMQSVPLGHANLGSAVLASGAIPMVLDGVRDIPGARSGVYRDGGVTDYHFDAPLDDDGALVLYPHFYPYLVPGWFDKKLGRRASNACLDNVLLVCPSPAFVERLPRGKIPDRTDFVEMDEATRIDTWKSVVAACERLGDELRDALDRERVAALVQPIDT